MRAKLNETQLPISSETLNDNKAMNTTSINKPQLSESLLGYFYFTALLSIFVDLGLSSALKGAAVGTGEYIAQSTHIGALLSQFTAISASLILVFSTLRCLTRFYRSWEVWPAACLALGAQLLLFIAMQGRIGLPAVILMSACSGLSLFLLSFLRTKHEGGMVTTLASIVILLSALSFYSWPAAYSETLVRIFSLLEQVLQWFIVLGLLIITAKRSRLIVFIALTLGLLLAYTASDAASQSLSTSIIVTGRVVRELVKSNAASFDQILPVCLTICLVILQLFISQKMKTRMIALGALAALLPLTPLALSLALAAGWYQRQAEELKGLPLPKLP